MTLIVSRKPNGGYNGRFAKIAKDLILGGTRVGMIHIGPEDTQCFCHICKTYFPKHTRPEGFDDDFGKCTNCQAPFVFWWV